MNPNSSHHIKAILQALFVTFLWSTSFVIIKLGLDEIPPLTFAGLRYFVAFMCLLPFALTKKRINEIKQIEKRDWSKLIWLGLLFITFTQGAQFVGLSLLPAVTVSLLLNFSSAVVAVMAIFFLKEYPSLLQWGGALLFIVGALIYFYPVAITADQSLGLAIMMIGVLANAGSAVLGRGINREMRLSPFSITLVSMGIGSIILLTIGIITQGFLPLTFRNIIFIIWLAGINTAFAFVLWNLTLRTLSAMESSIINNTMLIQIALLA
ncbi:DMT family transporter, partial [Bacteroidota bacterium]